MKKFGSFFKPLMWFMALLLAVFVAGCGGGDGGGSLPTGAQHANNPGAVCTAGAACVDLLTAGEFVILTETGITDIPTSPITGNVGSSAITGAAILVTCAEVTGTISAADAAGPAPCSVAEPARLTQAIVDMTTAFDDARTRPIDVSPISAAITAADCAAALPGVYNWTTDVTIAENCTLTGNATDVWIFQVGGVLSQATNTTLTMAGGALPQNVFWQVDGNVSLLAGAHLEGIVLAATDISLVTSASVTGRLFSGTAVALDQNQITRPAP